MSVPLTGRIAGGPHRLLHEEVLRPQFDHELEHLLDRYVWIEKVLLVEYRRMDLVTPDEAALIGALLHAISADTLVADRHANMSDIAFAIERRVEEQLPAPVVRWHADRSRNDLQACAQVMMGRDRIAATVGELITFAGAALRLAGRTTDVLMPGYTHLQAAQVITPGFYAAAIVEQALHSIERLVRTYDAANLAPIGAGAMSGQQLAWDRDRMAELLGFDAPVAHALTAVASRNWALDATADLAGLGVALSRFVTDLMAWGSNEYRFFDLPDELSGISSAMPQKKNFPILERIRGKTAHLTAFHLDVALGQRNTPYSNMVEVSKEGGAHVVRTFDTAVTVLRLFTTVLDGLAFDRDRLRAVCEREFLGGFTLANLLTLRDGVPWRRAQVVAGNYIRTAVAKGFGPAEPDADLLRAVAAEHGHHVTDAEALLAEAFDPWRNLLAHSSPGSAHPDAVRELLAVQQHRLAAVAREVARRRATVVAAAVRTDRALGLAP